MADNMGRITILRAQSQELESERPPDPPSRPSAVGHGSAPVQSHGHSNSRATPVEGCPCRECRHARRRAAEVGLSPLEKMELVPDWKRALAAIGAVISAIVVCWVLGYAALWVLGVIA